MSIEPATFEQQYQALRDGNGLAELTAWSSVALTGADRQAFLHNFCTNDVKRLVPGTNCEAFVTNVKGKIVGHGLITCRLDELVIIATPNQSQPLIQHLDRYIIRDDVQLRDTTAERHYLLVAGECGPYANAAIPWNLIDSEFAYLLEHSPQESSAARAYFIERGFVVAGLQAFDAARIDAGVPLFGVDFDERNFPQEVGRDQVAISFTKGCYLGQETVARIDALGHVNQRLAGVRFSFAARVPEVGMQLSLTGKNVGQVTSATFSPRLNAPFALAMLRREANSPGTLLESPAGKCEVVSLPVG